MASKGSRSGIVASHEVSRGRDAGQHSARRASTAILGLILVVFVSGVAGCVQVEGGAVELSWSIRDFNDEKVECNDARIQDIRICWQATPDENTEIECRLSHSFPCLASRGVSEFEVDEGITAFFVQPRCSVGGQELVPVGDYSVPPPIEREVSKGKVVTLNQILVLVTPVGSCNPSKDRAANEVPCTCSEKEDP